MQKNAPLLAPVVLAAVLMGVYLLSLAPGLTWAHFGADGGDLIAAAATGGIAHPSGYPTYLLLARLFQALPLGDSLAYRTNLLSALLTAAASLALYALVLRVTGRTLPAFSAALAFGLAPLAWSQAVITEVYALHNFFVAVLLLLCCAPTERSSRLEVGTGLLAGLALGNHLSSLFLLPLLLAPGRRGLLLRLAGLAAGAMVYLLLPLWAWAEPAVNWGRPLSFDGFFWLVSGQLYRPGVLSVSWPDLLTRLSGLASLLLGQFGVPGLLAGLLGILAGRASWPLRAALAWLFAASTLFALLYATSDSFLYALPALLCFAVWMGLGLNTLLTDWLLAWPHLARLAAALFLGFLLLQAWVHWPIVDASADSRAEDFGRQVLASLPERAIVFAEGDRAVFSLWYFHFALGQRPDLVIVASDLLPFEWYADNLRVTYEQVNVPPGPLFPSSLAASNPDLPTCFVRYEDWTQLYCPPAAGGE
jgi:hypothetical protein